MPVRDLANSDVVTASRDESVTEIARKLADENVGTVVITEGDEPIGVVSDRDIALAIPEGDVSSMTAEDFLDREVVTVRADAEGIELARTIGEAKVRRIPVVDDGGSLVGIATLDDMVATIGEEMQEVANVIEAQSPGYSP
ncbi:CBS domain-containing protein [Halegenticoccus tardaugens]|uniref:CBS domain-containing protein n=1 Tax=Halegenticoccus tardaugens TaxID=2071624 RepID=UPI00100BA5D5|nr:CBS domain-containing protein [Halegenticoccus tardaugens]